MTVLTFESDEEWSNSVRIALQHGLVEPAPMGTALDGPHVPAYVNHGRWIGDCPVCRSARNLAVGRLFWCPACGNERWASAGLVVDWPDIETISQVLEVRPRENQNYDPADYLKHPYGCPDGLVWLAYENLLRGFRVPDLLKERAEVWILEDWAKRGLADEMAGFSPEKVV